MNVNATLSVKYIITFWEARWHGFAKWTIEKHVDHLPDSLRIGVFTEELDHGWWRPPKGWRWHQMELRDYDGTPLIMVANQLIPRKIEFRESNEVQ